MINNKFVKIGLILCSILLLMLFGFRAVDAKAAEKKYGIIISDQKGSYTFYDLNDSTKGKPSIELTDSGNIMIPLKTVTKLMPGLTYKYDKAKKTATVTNTKNGKKIVYKKNSSYLSYYAKSKAKAVKQKMTYPMYVSETNANVMVHMNTLRWLFPTTKGYQYYKVSDMQKMGYDTYSYSGLVVYNPYKSISGLTKASQVKGISTTVKVTIPEGYSVAQAFNLLVKKGVCASTDLLYSAMKNYDFTKNYSLIRELSDNKNRSFKLEGYLYPDTYEFYRLMKGEDVLGKFLRNAEVKITAQDRAKAKEMGLSVNELLTIASMIEKETGDKTLMPKIASVIYNRLNIGMKIQFDSSIFYVERYIKPYITGDINRYNSFYNTYKCPALPAGPICNPGRTAIQAALYPEATDFLFFYSDKDGVYHFSKEYVNPKAVEEQQTTENPNESENTTIPEGSQGSETPENPANSENNAM